MIREFTDSLGRPIRLPWPPQRVVSLVASQTETLVLLGLGERLVGRTRYCVEPRGSVEAIPVIGGEKSPDVAAILSLHPDLVIANKEENKKADVERLEAAGVPVYVAYPRTLEEGCRMVRELGDLTGTAARALELALPIEALLLAGKPPMSCRGICFIWKDPWMVAGSGNFVDDMMRWAGIENLGAKFGGRYPRVNLDAAMTVSPEVILLPDEPYLFEPRHRAEFENWPDVPAVRNGRILCLDGKALSWYGPRIATSLGYLRGRVGAS